MLLAVSSVFFGAQTELWVVEYLADVFHDEVASRKVDCSSQAPTFPCCLEGFSLGVLVLHT